MTAPGRFGAYELLRRLGRGGMAEAFVAVRRGPGKFEHRTCVKRILDRYADNPRFRDLFLSEARILARLRHANIVQLYDFGEVDGSYYLSMELVEGLDLLRLLRRVKEVPIPVGAQIVFGIASALDHAHRLRAPSSSLDPLREGLVHGDVTPSNVLLGEHGEVKLTDFGVARFAAEQRRGRPLVGKVPYMAPESIRGEVGDHRVDLFALGVVAYELLAGQLPFRGSSDASTLRSIVHEAHVPLAARAPQVPKELASVVEGLLHKRMEERIGSASDVAERVERFAQGLSGQRRLAEIVRQAALLPEPDGDTALRTLVETRAPGGLPDTRERIRLPPRRKGKRDPSGVIGRERDLARLQSARRSARLVTLLGPAGVGKTYLAERFLSAEQDVIRLRARRIRSSPDLLERLVGALDIPATTAQSETRFRQVAAAMIRQPRTLLLDGAEELVASCRSLLRRLLAETPISMLVTSREALGFDGEEVLRLRSLDSDGAIRLLRARAASHTDDFERADEDTLRAITEAVGRLPLAIVVLASQSERLDPAAMRAAVDIDSSASAIDRALEVVWQELPASMQDTVARLSVFEEGFGLVAARAILGEPPLSHLETLIARGLLEVEALPERGADDRFSLLEALRPRALGKSEHSAAVAEARRVHARFFSEHAERWATLVDSAASWSTLARFDVERANLLVALGWLESSQPRRAAQLGLALERWAGCRALVGLRERIITVTVAAAQRSGDPATIGKAMIARARTVLLTRAPEAIAQAEEALRYAEAKGLRRIGLEALSLRCQLLIDRPASEDLGALVQEGLERARALEDPMLEAIFLHRLAAYAQTQHDTETARRAFLAALSRLDGAPDVRLRARVLSDLGNLHVNQRETELARRRYEEALDLHRLIGEDLHGARTQGGLATLEVDAGHLELGVAHYREVIDVFARARSERVRGFFAGYLGAALHELGEHGEARSCLVSARDAAMQEENLRQQVFVLGHLGAVLTALGDFDEAARCREELRMLPPARQRALAAAMTHLLDGFLAIAKGEHGEAERQLEELSQVSSHFESRQALRLLQALVRAPKRN